MSFVLSTVMDAIAAELVTDIGATFRVSAYPVGSPNPPQAIVGYPSKLDYDYTFHALGSTGKISATFPIWYVVGQVLDKTSRDALSAVLTGAPGIAESLGGTLGGTVDVANVSDCQVETVTIGDVDYLSARFDLEVVG